MYKEIAREYNITKSRCAKLNSELDKIIKQTRIVKIVSFTNGTDAEILALVNASLNGEIDLYEDCGWRVGDEREIVLPAIAQGSYVGESHASQKVTIVLTHHGQRNGLTYSDSTAKNTDGSNRNYPAFEWDFKNCLSEPGYMNDTNTNSGSWNSSKRKSWIPQLVAVLPSYLVKKDFTVLTATSYNGTTTTGTTQKASLRAAKEIFGGDTATAAGAADTSHSNLTEFNTLTQVDWYKTTSHRIKKLGGNASEQSSDGDTWWERSPYYNNATHFCCLVGDGTATRGNARTTNGLSPFGCLG